MAAHYGLVRDLRCKCLGPPRPGGQPAFPDIPASRPRDGLLHPFAVHGGHAHCGFPGMLQHDIGD
jgi:hypothetical protein